MNEMIAHIINDRKIPAELLESQHISYDPSLRVVKCDIRDEYGQYVGRIDYNPFVRQGNSKYNKNLKQNTRPVIYNAQNLRNVFYGRPLFLVEGVFDCLTLQSLGYNAVALLTADLNKRDLQLISRYTDKIIVAFDNDSAGARACDKIFERFSGQYKLYRFRLNGAKDTNDLLVSDADSLRKQLEEFIKQLGDNNA